MILLDTCALLWLVLEPRRLSARAHRVIAEHAGRLAVSAISAFEVAIKVQQRKLALPLPADACWKGAVAHHGIDCIPVSAEIALSSVALAPHHQDPSDRIIIATALQHGVAIVTSDAVFQNYEGVRMEW